MEVDGAAAAGAASAGAKPLTPEEEALRRNTDCVYFLASPLTCKKTCNKNRLPGPNYIAVIAVLVAASGSIYLNTSTENRNTNDSHVEWTEEHLQILKDYRVDKFYNAVDACEHADLPPSVDWVRYGAITSVKDQGGTAACAMCAVISAIEGRHQILTGEAIELSMQPLIDCSGFGCKSGAIPAELLMFLTKEGCISAEHYRYTGELGKCRSKECPVSVEVNGFFTMDATEECLKYAVSVEPTIARIYCSNTFVNFKGGRTLELKDCPPPPPLEDADMNRFHAVVVVGYGEDNDGLFWLILNSWGANWGDGGFSKLRRGVADDEGASVGGITGSGVNLIHLHVLD